LYPFFRKDHSYDFYSVILFTEGKGTLKINNETYPVEPDTISLISQKQVHSFEGLGNVNGIVFFFCQDFFVEEFSFVRLLNVFSCTSRITGNICNPCINLSSDEFDLINSLLGSIITEYEKTVITENSPVIIRSLLNIMLIRLSEMYNARLIKHKKTESVLMHELSHLIDAYFIKEHNVTFYSSAFNISDKHMNEICRRYFNYGLKKILTDRLMQEARKLLLSTEFSVSEISYKLNFDDDSYFNKVFSRQTGLTPKKFRDLHKKLLP
jgi:AraC-like DNA-binding protein